MGEDVKQRKIEGLFFMVINTKKFVECLIFYSLFPLYY